MNYLLIHEDGFVEDKEVQDVSELLDGIDAGILEVIRVQKYQTAFETLMVDGTWRVIGENK